MMPNFTGFNKKTAKSYYSSKARWNNCDLVRLYSHKYLHFPSLYYTSYGQRFWREKENGCETRIT